MGKSRETILHFMIIYIYITMKIFARLGRIYCVRLAGIAHNINAAGLLLLHARELVAIA